MLKNFWWPLGFGSEITREPQHRRFLDQDFVLFRTGSGSLVIMHDRCPTCGSALSAGHLDGDLIVCPIDKSAFDPSGRCIRFPGGDPDPHFVDSYPTQERYGWFFAFAGDLPEAERFPIPDLPYVEEPGFKKGFGTFEWDVHYARALENGVDAAHTPFVHGGAFGNPDEPEIEEYEVEEFENSGRAVIYLTPQPSKGLWRFLYRRDPVPVKTLVQWWLPNMSLLEVHIPLGKLFIFNAHVPIDEFKTVSHYISLRTFFKADWADKDSHRRVLNIFNQDKAVVEAQRPELLPFDLGAELHVKSDLVQIAFRKARQIYKEKGWSIATAGRPESFVIPSPVRREMQGHKLPN